MSNTFCYWNVCFAPLIDRAEPIFEFPDFLSGLALMVVVWTIADFKYRFRISTAPLPVYGISISVVSFVGLAVLLTDLWRAQQWPVPIGPLSPSLWQAFLAALVLLVLFMWIWFALVRPSVFGRLNAHRFASAVYRVILKGAPDELPSLAYELATSAKSLIRLAPDRHAWNDLPREERHRNWNALPEVRHIANDLLLLIADHRFCAAVVESAPVAALAIFEEMNAAKKYGASVQTFGRNVVAAALKNPRSFIYYEAEGYDSGLLGYHKPLTQAMFGNYFLVEAVGQLLDVDYREQRTWKADEWRAYCRIVLMTFDSYLENGQPGHSFALYRAKGEIQESCLDLTYAEDVDTPSTEDARERLRIAVDFAKDVIERLNKHSVPRGVDGTVNRVSPSNTWYDHAAALVAELIWTASRVKGSTWTLWHLQHNTAWGTFFNFSHCNGPAADVIKQKVLAHLWEEIEQMKRIAPNYKGASVIRFCLNVLGLKVSQESYYDDSRDFHEKVLAWVKQNYAWLHSYNPNVAAACLANDITYDSVTRTLTKTYPVEGLRREAQYVTLQVDPIPPGAEAPN